MEDDAQVEHMGSDLEAQVKKLVMSLRELTTKQRQRIIEQIHKDCTKVRQDISDTLSIQQYLASLLAETDPYLLIWVGLCADQTVLCKPIYLLNKGCSFEKWITFYFFAPWVLLIVYVLYIDITVFLNLISYKLSSRLD